MKKALLLLVGMAFVLPAPAANAACAETHGSSAHVHSGRCGQVESMLLNVDEIVDPIICAFDNVTSIIQC